LLPQAVARVTWPAQQKQPSKPKPPKAKAAEPGEPQQNLLQQAYDAIEKNDFAAALPLLQKHLAEKPDDANAHFQLGFVLTRLGRGDEAEAPYRRAIELDPKMVAAYQNLGTLLAKPNPAEAVKLLTAALQLQPENAEIIFMLGVAEDGLNHPERAAEYYRQAARARPKDFEIRLTYAYALFRLQQYVEAEREFRAALELRPNAPQAQLGLAQCFIALEKREQAIPHLRRYLAAEPNDVSVRLQLAVLLFDSGKIEEAFAEIERTEKDGQTTLPALELRANFLIRRQRFDEAIGVIEHIVKLRPDDAAWRARLGRLYLEKRNFAPAERELRAALKLEASQTDALRDLVSVYYLGEKYAAALEALDELGRREEPNAGHWFVRAVCLDKLQRKPEALAAYEKFVELDQGRNADKDFQARQRIKTLKRELERKR
jgi:Flp pilus assembly protein TadD